MFCFRKLCTIAGVIATWMAASGAAPAPAATPNFAPDDRTSWVPARPAGDEFILPERGPGPVSAEQGHQYVPNGVGQPTYRIADLSNPNLKPWGAEKNSGANDPVRPGQVPYLPH